MDLTAVFLMAAPFAAVASALSFVGTVTLVTESSNPELNDKGIGHLNWNRDQYYEYIMSAYQQKSTFHLYDTGAVCLEEEVFCLGVYGHTAIDNQRGPLDVQVLLKDNYLTVNGSSGVLYACNPAPLFDRENGYTGIGVYMEGEDVPDTCEPIKIKGVNGAGSASLASVPVSAPRSSKAAEADASEDGTHTSDNVRAAETSRAAGTAESSGHSEGTAAGTAAAETRAPVQGTTVAIPNTLPSTSSPMLRTTVVPVQPTAAQSSAEADMTKWTTIECPSATTFAYGSRVVTVSSATTLTIEDCSCTAKPVIPNAPDTSGPAIGAPSASAPALNDAPRLKVSMLQALGALGIIIL